MLCGHAIRRLKPGTYNQFVSSFGPPDEAADLGWTRFHILRSVDDPNEVITFGFFDGTTDELEASQDQMGYRARRAAIEPLVETLVTSGVYEIVETRIAQAEAAV